MRVQGRLVEVDLHLSGRAAIGVGGLGPGDGADLRPDEVLREVVQRGGGEHVARQGELDDRHARRVVGEHQRRGDAGGSCFNWVCEIEVTCAWAAVMSTFG